MEPITQILPILPPRPILVYWDPINRRTKDRGLYAERRGQEVKIKMVCVFFFLSRQLITTLGFVSVYERRKNPLSR
jgi:hypothetical protein